MGHEAEVSHVLRGRTIVATAVVRPLDTGAWRVEDERGRALCSECHDHSGARLCAWEYLASIQHAGPPLDQAREGVLG